jgi:flagellar basal-body rod protein FlgF
VALDISSKLVDSLRILFLRCLAQDVHFALSRMDPISVLAAGGIRSRMESLDLLANNLANSATSGYKSDREFYSLFTSDYAQGNTSTVPLVERKWTDFSQGLLQNTSNPLDVALSGNGFFTVNGPSGPLYTRNGSFQVGSSGNLSTSDGYAVMAQGGGAIPIDPSLPVTVTPEGDVQQSGVSVGQLDLVSFADTTVLAKQGNNYFRNTNASVIPAAATDIEVHQAQTENSNVNTAGSAVQLVGVMRQFEMLQKAITMSLDMDRKGIDEVARIPQ